MLTKLFANTQIDAQIDTSIGAVTRSPVILHPVVSAVHPRSVIIAAFGTETQVQVKEWEPRWASLKMKSKL